MSRYIIYRHVENNLSSITNRPWTYHKGRISLFFWSNSPHKALRNVLCLSLKTCRHNKLNRYFRIGQTFSQGKCDWESLVCSWLTHWNEIYTSNENLKLMPNRAKTISKLWFVDLDVERFSKFWCIKTHLHHVEPSFAAVFCTTVYACVFKLNWNIFMTFLRQNNRSFD